MTRDLTVAEAADLVGVSERSLRRWCQDGRIRARQVGGYHGAWRLDHRALAAAGLLIDDRGPVVQIVGQPLDAPWPSWPTGVRSTAAPEDGTMTNPTNREPDELAQARDALADLVGDHTRLLRLLDAAHANLTAARRGADDAELAAAAQAVGGLQAAVAEVADEHERVSERVAALEAELAERERQAANAAAVAEADAATERAHQAAATFVDGLLAAHADFRDALDATNRARAAARRPALRVQFLMQTAAGNLSNRSLAHQIGAVAGHAPARHTNDRPTAAERRQAEADRRERGRLAKQANALAFLRGQATERADRFAAVGLTAPAAELQGWTATLDRIAREHGPDALDGLDLPPGYVVPTDPPGADRDARP